MSGKRVTMQQVADEAGVSRTTVSFVLNNTPNVNISAATRARVWQAVANLNYARTFAARSLATGRSQTIAFILRQMPDELLVNAFLGGLLSGVTQAISADNYRLLFEAVGHDASAGAYTELVRTQRVDGLIISGPVVDDIELRRLHRENVPIVVNGKPDFEELYSVDVDNVASARTAVQHLIDLGHRRIAHITNGPLNYTASSDRLEGYQQGLLNAGLPCEDRYVQVNPTFTDQGGYEAMRRLLDLPERPTAVFAASDVVAFGAIRAIQEAGLRIPTDISIVGFDDIPLVSYLAPGLTTIHIPVIQLGVRAGEMLMQLIQGDTPVPRRVLLETRLVIRHSTAPLQES